MGDPRGPLKMGNTYTWPFVVAHISLMHNCDPTTVSCTLDLLSKYNPKQELCSGGLLEAVT